MPYKNPRKTTHHWARRVPVRGGIRIECRQEDYEPPASTSKTVQEMAFVQHRIAMGEKVSMGRFRKRLSIDLSPEEFQRLTDMAAREGMTAARYAKRAVQTAIQDGPER